jgi:hypothetical protein
MGPFETSSMPRCKTQLRGFDGLRTRVASFPMTLQ